MSKINKNMLKRFTSVLIIALGGAIIYGLPYFRFDYYDVYLKTYHLTNAQMGTFGSILGIFGMISYLFGGVVADRFSTKMILTVSLIGTGLGGLIHLLPLNYPALVVLYAYWGVTSLFAFWPACVKAVRIVGGAQNQGKAFGFFEGGRGIGASLMTVFAIIVFRIGTGRMNNQVLGMRYVIIFYSVLTIALGIITFFCVKDDDRIKSEKISFKGIGHVLKMPAVWIISFVTFSVYVFTQSLYYFTPYSTEFFSASVTFAATIASVRRWVSIFGSVGGGFMTDKFGTVKTLLFSFLVMIAGTISILLLPLKASSLIPFVIIFLIVFVFYNVNYSITWAMMDEGAIDVQYSGTAAGVISTLGYLPEIFCSVLAGKMIDSHPGVAGYRDYFAFLIVMLILGVVFVLIWAFYLRTHKKSQSTGAKAND